MPYKEWISTIQKLYLSGKNKQTNEHIFNQDRMQNAPVLSSEICPYFVLKKYDS